MRVQGTGTAEGSPKIRDNLTDSAVTISGPVCRMNETETLGLLTEEWTKILNQLTEE